MLYVYGADAEALFEVMEPTLRGLPFRPAHVVLRKGSRGDRVPSGFVMPCSKWCAAEADRWGRMS